MFVFNENERDILFIVVNYCSDSTDILHLYTVFDGTRPEAIFLVVCDPPMNEL